MKVRELIAELKRLPPDAEIGMLTAAAHARPPQAFRVDADAGWRNQSGFDNPERAYLLRPQNEII